MNDRRRLLDLAVAIPGAILTFPLLVALCVAATVTTRAPGIYRQTRIGRHGEAFTLFKIRSMTVSDETGTITAADDLRITALGAQLRRFKLDELPQLWNVVAGRMSMVGPRPDVPGYADRLEGDDREVLSLRPGITGPASLVFRDEERLLADAADAKALNDTTLWPEKVSINLAYARHATLLDDIQLVVMTLRSDPDRLSRMLQRWDPCLSDLPVAGRLLASQS